MGAIFKKFREIGRIPFVMAFLSFLLYWLALPRSGQFYLVFLVPMFWTFLVFRAQEKDTIGDDRAQWSEKKSGNDKKEDSSIKKTGRGFFSWIRRFIMKIFRDLTSFYGQIWLAAAIFWLVLNHWLMFPHPFLVLGWLALSLYLAFYVPLYVWLVRRLTVQLNMPILLASPLCWVAVEWLRKHGFGGYSFGSLEHVFYRMPRWIQLSGGLFGEYAVGVWIILIGTCLALLWQLFRKRKYEWGILTVIFLILLLDFNWTYGGIVMKRIRQSVEQQNNPPVRVALLQEPTCFTFPVSDKLNLKMHQEYLRLTNEVLTLSPKPDLIVWPESSSIDTEILAEKGAFFPGMDRLNPEERQKRMDKFLSDKRDLRAQWLNKINTPVLYGVGSMELKEKGTPESYNSAIYWDGRGKFQRYDKMSLIMFGEYFPLIEYLPKSLPLRSLCNSVLPGRESVIFPLYRRNDSVTTAGEKAKQPQVSQESKLSEASKGSQISKDSQASKGSKGSQETEKSKLLEEPEEPVEMAVNICFESTLPHFIAGQLDDLEKKGKYPTVLINISNIGWFQHSVQNEFHLATHVFRAVENRKTVLTSTHGGFSAAVAPDGTIFALGTNGKAEAVIADFQPVSLSRSGFLAHHLPVYDLIFVCGLILGSFCRRSKQRSTEGTP